METFKVTITGQQKHISGSEYENQTTSDIENILNKYWDDEYPKPENDGNSWELNNDQFICIEKE